MATTVSDAALMVQTADEPIPGKRMRVGLGLVSEQVPNIRIPQEQKSLSHAQVGGLREELLGYETCLLSLYRYDRLLSLPLLPLLKGPPGLRSRRRLPRYVNIHYFILTSLTYRCHPRTNQADGGLPRD